MKGFKLVTIVSLIVAIILFPSHLWTKPEVDPEWKKVIKKYYSTIGKSGDLTWNEWERGVKKELDFELKEIVFEVNEFLRQEEYEDRVLVGFILIVKGLCLNKDGEKKTVESIRGMILVINKISKKVEGGTTVTRMPTVVRDGWNTRDI